MQNHYKYINLAPTAGKGDKKTEGALIFIQYWLHFQHLTVPTPQKILDTQLSSTVLMCLFQLRTLSNTFGYQRKFSRWTCFPRCSQCSKTVRQKNEIGDISAHTRFEIIRCIRGKGSCRNTADNSYWKERCEQTVINGFYLTFPK